MKVTDFETKEEFWATLRAMKPEEIQADLATEQAKQKRKIQKRRNTKIISTNLEPELVGAAKELGAPSLAQ
jgi:hypothetical protein